MENGPWSAVVLQKHQHFRGLPTTADFATTAATRTGTPIRSTLGTGLGRPDGIWLHVRCEAPWYDQENAARDLVYSNGRRNGPEISKAWAQLGGREKAAG